MALQPNPIRVPFVGGINTKTDEKAVEPPQLLDLQNGVFTKSATIAKRHGYESLSLIDDDNIAIDATKTRALAVRDEELILLATDGARTHRESNGRWSRAAPVRSVTAREYPVSRTGTEQTQADQASNGGVTVTAWKDSRGGVWWSAAETVGGKVLIKPQQCPDGERPRVVAVGSVIHVYYVKGGSEIWVVVIVPTNINASHAPVPLISNLYPATPHYDACESTYSGQGVAFIAWATAPTVGPTADYSIAYVHESGVLGSSATSLPPPDNIPNMGGVRFLTVYNFDQVRYVGFTIDSAGGLFYVDTYFEDFTHITNVVITGNGLAPTNGAIVANTETLTAAIEYESATTDANRDRRIVFVDYDFISTTEEITKEIRGVCLASKFCEHGDTKAVYLVHDVPLFSVYLLTATDGTVIARTMPINAYGRPDGGWLPRWSSDGDLRSLAMTLNDRVPTTGGFTETRIARAAINFEDGDAWQSAQLGGGLYLAGACPVHYDGTRWAEMGFHYGADGEIGVATYAPSGAGLTGTHLYVFVYEEIDALGEIHRGPVSVGTSATTAGQGNRLTIPTYRLTGKESVRIGVYRSLNGESDALYRVSSLNPSATGANGYVVNDVTVDTVTFDDEMSDAELINQEPLYTNGGIASNDPVTMAGDVIVSGKNRLFFTDPSDPNLVRYSQEFDDGYGAELAPPLSLRIDAKGGKITGIGVMDDSVVVCKEHADYVFSGPGPLANPTADPSYAFTPPALVTSDSGCASPRSIVPTPVGITIKTAKGIQMLGRDRQIVDIGGPVEGFDSQDVSRATLLTDRKEIVFLTSSGRTLLFDYEHNAWSTWTNHEGRDACVVGGVYHYLRSDGRVFRESEVYSDGGRHIKRRTVTAWIKPLPYLQGWGRVWYAHFLGTYLSAHKLRVRYALDYEASWSEPFDAEPVNWVDATAYGAGPYGDGDYGGSGSTVYQWRAHIGKRCQAIRFEIEDVEADADFGAAFELTELLLTGGPIRDAKKLEATRSG